MSGVLPLLVATFQYHYHYLILYNVGQKKNMALYRRKTWHFTYVHIFASYWRIIKIFTL